MNAKLQKIVIRMSKLAIYVMIVCQTFSMALATETAAQRKYLEDIEVKISNSPESRPLLNLIREVESISDFKFAYAKADIRNKAIDIDGGIWNMRNLLKEVSTQSRLSIQRVNESIALVVAEKDESMPKVMEAIDVQQSVSGKVTDESGEGLPGATVQEKGTSNGTITDVDGTFQLNVQEDATLTISFVGYETQEIPLNGRSVIDVQLDPDISALDEVVVVGYGTQKREDLTGSIVSVNSDILDKQGSKVNILQSLQGAVPGLNIAQSGNDAAQSSFNITVRGQNSIAANNTPLIVLDGVPYSGGLNEIDQNDIKSIEVLKDASAAAIYGSRGANGVILITTKKGKVGKPTITYNGSYGLQEIYNLPDILNGQEYWDYAIERNGGDENAFRDAFPTVAENYDNGNSVDWVDLATRTGKQQKHALKLSGGSENVNYYLAGTFTDVKGIALGDNFQQILVRANLSINVTDWLEIGTNSQYSHQDLSGLEARFGNPHGAFGQNPLINPFNDAGEYEVIPWPEQPIYGNPLLDLNVQEENFRRRLFSNNYINIQFPFLKGLSYKLNTGFTITNRQIGRFWGNNTLVGQVNQGQSYVSNENSNDQLIENILSYSQIFGKHNLNVTALYSYQSTSDEEQELNTQRFPTEVLTWYQPDVALVLNPSARYVASDIISQMARFNYGYDSRYLVTFTVRRDGYSGFGRDNKFGIFPSVALGWNVSRESFFPQSDAISLIKLRASFGKNGNQAIRPYQTLAGLDQLNFLGGSNANQTAPGYFPESLSTPNLGWETSTAINVGIDYGLLDNRLIGSIDFYSTKTVDLLLNRAISPVHGITSIIQNIGETKNDGVEFNLTSTNIDNGSLNWTTQFNISFNNNEIVDLYGNKEDDISNGWFIGKPIDANFGYVIDGIWQTGEDNSIQPGALPGDIKIKDTDGDGVITADDRDIMGQSSPRIIAGLTNILTYKDLSLSFFFYTQQKVTRVNALWDTNLITVTARENTLDFDWWTPENPTNEYPANRNGTNPFDARFYQNASFVRLRDVTLSYSIPSATLEAINLRQLQLYVSVKNALTFTEWQGMDPELSDQRAIPMDRTLMFGLNIGL